MNAGDRRSKFEVSGQVLVAYMLRMCCVPVAIMLRSCCDRVACLLRSCCVCSVPPTYCAYSQRIPNLCPAYHFWGHFLSDFLVAFPHVDSSMTKSVLKKILNRLRFYRFFFTWPIFATTTQLARRSNATCKFWDETQTQFVSSARNPHATHTQLTRNP